MRPTVTSLSAEEESPGRRGERWSVEDVGDDVAGRWPLPEIDEATGKLGRGTVLIIGGSNETPGSVLLAGVAALRAGAGRLQIATAAGVAPAVAVGVPESRVLALATGEWWTLLLVRDAFLGVRRFDAFQAGEERKHEKSEKGTKKNELEIIK